MTDTSEPLSAQLPVPSQTVPLLPPGAPAKEEVAHKVETVEEEPYTIKCICNFSDDDGNTIYCETCDTWQHIECFYPDNREEAIREDFAHSCADCKPRPLNRQKAIQRTSQLKHVPTPGDASEKKTKRPPSKSHKKKKPNESINGIADAVKLGPLGDTTAQSKKSKAHRASQSISSQHPKRSPSVSQPRPQPAHPPSPANSPPDLPDDFTIHHYSDGFYALYNDRDVVNTENNQFASLAIPTALARWLREPETMKQEVGRTHSDVFQEPTSNLARNDDSQPKLEVQDATRVLDGNTTLRWRSLKATQPIDKDVPLIELNGEIGFQKDYCSDADNLWADLSSPLPFVFFHPVLPLYIDTRKEGSLARYVRRSCKPNAQLDTYLSDGSEYHFWLVSDRHIGADEQVTLPWDFRLEKSVGSRWLHLLGLNDEDAPGQDEPEMDDTEYFAISNWVDRILSEYGGCACDLENNCAFARFHRHYLHGKSQTRVGSGKKKHRKSRTHTISPTSTGHVSRAASEGHVDDGQEPDAKSQSGSSRSKPSSRDPTPMRQGSFDQLGILTEPTDRDKRKVAMVEDSFRRMEQQQPPRKKKRVSDGTVSGVPRSSKQRAGSAGQGQYVDASTGRSKSGSPASAHSPTFSTASKLSRRQSLAVQPGKSPLTSRLPYSDASVQTDDVQGEWFSCPLTPQKPQKRVISLARRLLNSRQRVRTETERQKRQPLTPRTSTGSAMEMDVPTVSSDVNAKLESEVKSPSTSTDDVVMPDATESTSTPAEAETLSELPEAIKKRSPDLRVQMPPVPSFDHQVSTVSNSTTPASATGTFVQSPFSVSSLPTPFHAPPSIGGMTAQPSPAKKKLSLSDYTRRSKAAGKVAGGSAVLKPTLPSPEENKVDIVVDTEADQKDHDVPTVPVNGHV